MKNLPSKILKSSVYPAGFMVLGKIIGMIIITSANNYPFVVQNNVGGIFSMQFTYATTEQVNNVASFSNTFMFGFVFIGALFWIIRALFFHDSHESPRVVVKLSELNLTSFITDTYSLYVPLFCWILYLWLTTLLISIDTYAGKSGILLLVIVLIVSVFLTGLGFSDVQREFQKKNKLYIHEYE